MATHSTPLSHSHDLTRDEIISRFRDRIAQGKRTKLTKDELGQLILHFIDRLQPIKSAAKIQALCEAEIALLEVGYPQSTLASDYIPKYRKAIERVLLRKVVEDRKLLKEEIDYAATPKISAMNFARSLTAPFSTFSI